MFIACWSSKGGSGTTVTAVALACMLGDADPVGAVIVDLAGDVPAALGVPEPEGPGIAEWLRAGDEVPADGLTRIEHEVRPGLALLNRGTGSLDDGARAEVLGAVLAADHRTVVVDCGRVDAADPAGPAGGVGAILASAATHSLLVVRPCYLALRRAVAMPFRPSGVVVVDEVGRCLTARDVETVLEVPVVATVPHDVAVGRCVDAGVLASRLPTGLARALRRAA